MLQACREASQKVFQELGAKDPMFKKLYDSMTAFRDKEIPWFRVAEGRVRRPDGRAGPVGSLSVSVPPAAPAIYCLPICFAQGVRIARMRMPLLLVCSAPTAHANLGPVCRALRGACLNSMRTRIKICGLTREQIDAAVSAGVDAIGFVFYPKSKRA